MPRIRTIKPEFFTSEQVVECSPMARLLFVGMWCFCDDGGVHPASAVTLKMEVFPADAISVDDVRGYIAELESHGLIETYVIGVKSFWRVVGWYHQKIDKPTYKHPRSREFGEESSRSRRAFGDSSTPERSGAESSRVESNPDRSVGADPDRCEDLKSKEEKRSDVISSLPMLSEAVLVAVDSLPSNSLASGAFAALKDHHLSDTPVLLEWFQRQLGLPDPVCPATKADLLLVLATGIYAAKVPAIEVKKSRCAIFVDIINKGRWRKVTPYIDHAVQKLNEHEAKGCHESTQVQAS